MAYKTHVGSLDAYDKGTIELADDLRKYAFSNIYEVAGKAAPFGFVHEDRRRGNLLARLGHGGGREQTRQGEEEPQVTHRCNPPPHGPFDS